MHLDEKVEVHTTDTPDDNPAETKQALEHKLAALFLCMRKQLHVFKRASQHISNAVTDILTISKSNTLAAIKDILQSHNCDVNQSVFTYIARFT